MTRGGPGRGQGRPHGSTTRTSPESTRAALTALLLPGETWAALGRRLGIPDRQTLSRALAKGATERQLSAWVLAHEASLPGVCGSPAHGSAASARAAKEPAP